MSKRKSRPVIRWTSYSGFLFAAIGASVGLGNVWRFPYELGIHGGTFLYVYLASVLVLGLPLMVSELALGRMGNANPVRGLVRIARQHKLSSLWQIIAWMAVITSFLVFSFYSVVASWVLFYAMQSFNGAYQNMPAEVVQNSFGALLRNTDQMLIWHSVFILAVVLVLAQTVRTGLERTVKFLMPMFIALLVWLLFYVQEYADYNAATEFMFAFDWQALTPELLVSAITQALFSLSIGIGILLVYGAYLNETRPLFTGATTIMLFDSTIAIIVSAIVFSVVFAFNLAPDSGPGLMFETLPVAFAQMQGNSQWIAFGFFILVLFSALSSGFALLEPSVAMFSDRYQLSRRVVAWLVGTAAWLLGLVSIYSFNDWRFSFYYFGIERSYGYFDGLILLTIHLLIPISALLIVVFVAWRVAEADFYRVLRKPNKVAFLLWRFCIRFVVPLIIALLLITELFYPA